MKIKDSSPDFSPRKIFSAEDYGKLLNLILSNGVVCLYEVATGKSGMSVLRHDIDHDIETALRMAEWEAERGLRATYCILHTAWYYGEFRKGRYVHTKRLGYAIKKLAELGHEINFHNNLIVTCFQNKALPSDLLKSELEYFRSMGINIVGTSTHGDSLCRQYGFRNYHLFSEVAAVDPPPLSDDCPAPIKEAIGSVSMADFGLSYEAYGFSSGRYISDSGGNLISHLSVPGWAGKCLQYLESIDRKVETYLLTHPIWWKF